VLVADESMIPTLRPGDLLLVDRGAYRQRLPEVGDIVVLVDPEDARRWLIKRVAAVDPEAGAIEVRGDAAEVARDSRRFGPVPLRTVIGRAYRRYAPADRRGDL
jgi:nickel-type superoxide dismutase maturation protease